MTGYGRGEVNRNGYNIVIEIKSINHRYCDISIKAPRHLVSLEDRIKGKIKNTVDRGRFEVFINLESRLEDNYNIKVDIPLAKAYMKAIESLEKEISIYSDITMDRFLDFPDILIQEKQSDDLELIWRLMDEALGIALLNLVSMRAEEGANILKNIEEKMGYIEHEIEKIEGLKSEVTNEYKEKLESRISEILGDRSFIDQGRLATEVAYYADKANVDEEIMRLKSHIEQLRKVANSDGSIGKKLDFIIQEVNRESNTIGSKTGNLEITNCVVELKSKTEEIREQIQNVE